MCKTGESKMTWSKQAHWDTYLYKENMSVGSGNAK